MVPYIGITDFTKFSQVELMLAIYNCYRIPSCQRLLHVGVMMSYKTLNDLPTRWSKAFPPKEEIATIFASDQTMNCLHYADYDTNPNLADCLRRAVEYGGDGITALQLDMPWPDPWQVAEFLAHVRASRPLEVILQVGGKSLAQIDEYPWWLVRKLDLYPGIQRILLDRSMGRGQPMDAAGLRPFIMAVRKYHPNLGIGVAGGLGPVTVPLLEPLLKEFPDLSWDAQGRLRQSGSALDPIDWTLASEYLIESLGIAPCF